MNCPALRRASPTQTQGHSRPSGRMPAPSGHPRKHGPDFFQFGDPEDTKAALAQAGFSDVAATTVAQTLLLKTATGLVNLAFAGRNKDPLGCTRWAPLTGRFSACWNVGMALACQLCRLRSCRCSGCVARWVARSFRASEASWPSRSSSAIRASCLFTEDDVLPGHREVAAWCGPWPLVPRGGAAGDLRHSKRKSGPAVAPLRPPGLSASQYDYGIKRRQCRCSACAALSTSRR
ncbi:hypothetical protein ACVIIW_002694 [Bradyrhizobium sp. USDA 4449]